MEDAQRLFGFVLVGAHLLVGVTYSVVTHNEVLYLLFDLALRLCGEGTLLAVEFFGNLADMRRFVFRRTIKSDEQRQRSFAVTYVAHGRFAEFLAIGVVEHVIFELEDQSEFVAVGAHRRLLAAAGTGGDCSGFGAGGKEFSGFLTDNIEVLLLAYPHGVAGVQLYQFAGG